MAGITITPTTNWNFTFTELTGVTGDPTEHVAEKNGTLLDANEMQSPDLDAVIVYGPLKFSFSFLWETGRLATPISWFGPGPSPASGPVFATFRVTDSNIDFLQQGQTLTQTVGVTVTDANDGESGVANLSLTVIGRNDAPIATADNVALSENITVYTRLVTGNDIDPDHGGAAVADERVAITQTGTTVFSVASAFSTFLNIGDVTLERVNFINNNLTAKDSLKTTLSTAFQSLMAGESALITIIYQIQDPWGANDGAQYKITVIGANDAQIIGTAASNTRLFGENDADVIFALGGNDVVHARGGSDTVYGDAGLDFINGGLGRDILWGQGNNDKFDYNSVLESGILATTRDVIMDFSRVTGNRDVIDLSTIDWIPGGVNNAFVLLARGTAATAAAVASGRIEYYWEGQSTPTSADNKTILRINGDADIAVDMTIELRGLFTLSGVSGVDIIL